MLGKLSSLIETLSAIDGPNIFHLNRFCGAILFSKVLKIQREAPVEFSAGICLRYNLGDNTGSSSHGILSDCPRLEFRVVNYVSVCHIIVGSIDSSLYYTQ